MKITELNSRASDKKWQEYNRELEERYVTASNKITNENNQIKIAARNTIGKTTYIIGGAARISKEVKRLQEIKRKTKKRIETKNGKQNKNQKITI